METVPQSKVDHVADEMVEVKRLHARFLGVRKIVIGLMVLFFVLSLVSLFYSSAPPTGGTLSLTKSKTQGTTQVKK